jgi:hypothetical protein
MVESYRKTGYPFAASDVIWLRQNPAGTVVRTEFFGTTEALPVGHIKYWTGAIWELKPVKYWNGTAWVTKPVKFWNGVSWTATGLGLVNQFTNRLDIFAWSGSVANAATITRDTTTGLSPAGGVPLKMAITGNDPHIGTYNGSQWNIAPAATGQTWQVKVWVKASVATTGEIFIFGVDSAGAFISNAGNAFNAGGFTVGTSWSEVSYSFTFADSSIAYMQTRLDGTPTGGAGINMWWDNLQVYRLS